MSLKKWMGCRGELKMTVSKWRCCCHEMAGRLAWGELKTTVQRWRRRCREMGGRLARGELTMTV